MGGTPSRLVLGLSAIDADLALLQAVRGRGDLSVRQIATMFVAEVHTTDAALQRLRERGWLDRASPASGAPLDADAWLLNADGAAARRQLLVDEALDAVRRLAIDRARSALDPLDSLVRDLRDAAGSAGRMPDDDGDQRGVPIVAYEVHARAERVVKHLAAKAPRFQHHAQRLANNDPSGLTRPVAGADHADSYSLAWSDLIDDIRSSVNDRATAGVIRFDTGARPPTVRPSPL